MDKAPYEVKLILTSEMIEQRLANASPEGFLFHRNGRQIKSIRRLCLTICEAVGIDSAHFFHNLRRSFRTNLGRAGIDDQTGMKLMGHRTVGVYNNYNQIDVDRLREALRKTQNTLDELKAQVELLDDNSDEQAFERVYQLVKKIEVQDKVLPYINRVLLIMLDHDRMVIQ